MRCLLSAALVALILSAASSAQPASLPSACGLLTSVEVQAALGAKIATRSNRDYDAHLRTCGWTSVPLGSFTSAQAYVDVQIRPSTRATFEEQKYRYPGAFLVRGIGEAAFATPAGNDQTLSVWDRGFALMFSVPVNPSPLQAEKALARHALTRLD